ncbi:hypothetical protein J3Q64DRAFT_1305331 [Phycomyces blakesleeanus]|uniref:Uncharacterized protein n=2 Tax=Phycomyces blakesleeanus TaxID=4837 RepID=A0A162NBE5_PHYB8|nr:hypothetical protein PHYBLDRAFT_69450 [Phycomyces blakesleeanus NRRL 1555(-)]OAD67584.1 hypothetical protein PHYBLDRAFT_69450 [Phycomyces blakesleeanus NRRL 1555(-)]|eukprot:XP_018285624.1 hypothetical protein PHYBLDRAFT_69450 [Phycomyces blakesleeanus NRRL 1555(-)]
MALATFGIITRRWKPTYLSVDSYNSYRGLSDHIPENLFLERITDLNLFIEKNYPHVYPDSYMFLVAIILIILAAVFSIVTRVLDISLWYPLLILIAPALIAYWTTRRRGFYYLRLNKFYDSLYTHLKEISSNDAPHHIRWGYRRLRDDDTADTLHLTQDISHWRIAFVIEIIQLDPEIDHSHNGQEVLPAYNAASQDVVLDIGPDIIVRPTAEQHNGDQEEGAVQGITTTTNTISNRSATNDNNTLMAEPPTYRQSIDLGTPPPYLRPPQD